MITPAELNELFVAKQMKLLVEKAERAKNTIVFCDTEISETIKNHAISTDGDDTYIEILFTAPWEKDSRFYLVKPDGKYYADGTPSMDYSCNDCFDYETFVSYCKTNGFRLYQTDTDYYHYGYGCRSGIKIAICWGEYTRDYWDKL